MPEHRKCVAIIGAGRVGSWIALNIAQIEIRRLVLIDDDRISEDNIKVPGMVPYTFFELDSYKCDTLARKVIAINKKAHVRAFRTKISPQMGKDALERIFGDSLLIIFAIDTVAGLKVLEMPEIMSKRLSIIPAMHHDGGGHIVCWIPSFTPCPAHTLGFESFDEIRESKASEAGISPADARIVSGIASELAVSLLFNRFGSNWKPFDIRKGNYLHIEKLKDGRYQKILINPHKRYGCRLCNLR